MAERLSDTRLLALKTVMEEWHLSAAHPRQQWVDGVFRTEFGPRAPTLEEFLSVLVELRQRRSTAANAAVPFDPAADTSPAQATLAAVDERLREMLAALDKALAPRTGVTVHIPEGADHDAIAQVVRDVMKENAPVRFIKPPSTSTHPGLKQETLDVVVGASGGYVVPRLETADPSIELVYWAGTGPNPTATPLTELSTEAVARVRRCQDGRLWFPRVLDQGPGKPLLVTWDVEPMSDDTAVAPVAAPDARRAHLEAVANAARDMHLGVAGAQQRLDDALKALDEAQ